MLLGKNYETKPISHKPFIINYENGFAGCFARGRGLFDPEMGLEDGIVVLGADALAGSKRLRSSGGFPLERVRDAEFAGQDVAMKSQSIGVGSALVGAGHGQFSVVTF
jgi:hypothetical protein